MRWRLVLIAVISMAAFGAQTAHASVIQMTPNNIGLVGYWSFNEGTSTIAHDFSGNGNNGTLSTIGSNLPQWVPGKLGTALSFDGSTSYISTSGPILGNAPFTFSVWALLKPGAGTFPMLFDDANQNKNLLFGANIGSLGDVGFNLYLNGLQTKYNVAPATNTWYHVVGVYDGSYAYIYVNGVLQSTSSGTGSSPGFNGVYIGNGSEDGNSFWKGVIDEVRIYNRALSAIEVAGLYQAGSARINGSVSPGTLSNGLVGWWTMDGADTVWGGPTTGYELDHSGNGNTGTLTNMNRSTSPTIGKIGQALSFNGSSSYVDAGNGGSLTTTGSFSVVVWAKDNWTTNQETELVSKVTPNSPFNGWSLGFGGTSDQNTAGTRLVAELLGPTISTHRRGQISNASVVDGLWHQWVAVFDESSDGIELYKDGVLLPSSTDRYVGSWPDPTTSNNLAIGNFGASGGNGYDNFDGSIDDVRIYNRALSASEIQQLYNMGK